MGMFKGGALRLFQTLLYAIAFCCAGIILGIYSYFLAVLADRNTGIAKGPKAVEGISGAAVLYTIFAVVFTCCLGGLSFFAFLAIILDVLFVGGFIAIAVLTRNGASSCTGTVNTPLGTGPASTDSSGYGGDFGTGGDSNLTYAVSLHTACRLNTAAFAVSLVGALIFIITALMQVALVRHHKKEKRYGPSPSNNYTSGFGKRKFWQRKPKGTAAPDTEMVAGGLAAPAPDIRPSYVTGTTMGNSHDVVNDKGDHNAYVPQSTGAHSGYYTAPHTAPNPYGSTGTATNY